MKRIPRCTNPDYCKEQTRAGSCGKRYSNHKTCSWQWARIGHIQGRMVTHPSPETVKSWRRQERLKVEA